VFAPHGHRAQQCPWVVQALAVGSSAWPATVAIVVPSARLDEFWAKTQVPSSPALPPLDDHAAVDAEIRAQATMAAQVLGELQFWCRSG